MQENRAPRGVQIIKTIYFYLVSFVALMMIVIPSANLLNLVMRNVVLKVGPYDYYPSRPLSVVPEKGQPLYDEEEERKRFENQQINQIKRDIARDVSFLAIGIPLFIFNWRLTKRNKIID